MSERARVVLLAGSRFSPVAGELAEALPQGRFDVHAVCTRVTLSRMRDVRPRRLAGQIRDLILMRVRRLLGGGRADGGHALCDTPGVTLHEVARIGDAESIALLDRLAPRCSVNTGGCGTLPRDLLGVAGPVLNVHCGLPHTRGFNAVAWTAWFGLPFRFCVHSIEPGVNTGPLLHERVLEAPHGLSADALSRAFDDNLGPLLQEAVLRLVSEGDDALVPQDLSRGRTFYAMHRDLREVLDEALDAGRPVAPWCETIERPALPEAVPIKRIDAL